MKFFLALAAMVTLASPLFGQCTYAVSPTTFEVGAGSATGSITGQASVSAAAGCNWQAKSNVSWITITLGQSGTGNGTVGWVVDRNPSPSARTGSIAVAGQLIKVDQAAAVCTYSISPTSLSYPVTGGNGTVQVNSSCLWAASGSQSWIAVPAGTQGTFDGKFNFTVQPNACVESRTGQVSVGLTGVGVQNLQISEDGSPSNLVLTPAAAAIGPGLVDGKLSIGLGSGCNWSAFSDVSWLTLTSPSSGSGPGTLSYRAAANPSSPRTGYIHIGPQLFAVTQGAVAAPAPQLNAVANTGSYAQGAVAPGEILSLFGSNLGPSTGVGPQLSTDGKSILKSLAGVQVTFDNTPATVLYASASQVNVVVPYAVAGNASTQIQLQYQGLASNTITQPAQPSAPGILTQDASGIGAGAILNQDFSLNAKANPAARGSVVQIYCTGGGVTNPASVDGALTGTPLPLITLPVLVTIGGLHADVTYSGGAPSSVAGLTQINAVVPSGVVPGSAVPLLVQIGDFSSQNGVTLAVK